MQKCAYSTHQLRPKDCLGDDVLLWKANNYPCHTIDSCRRQHDVSPDAWLCKNCASSRESKRLFCPKHGPQGGLAYYGSKARTPERVIHMQD